MKVLILMGSDSDLDTMKEAGAVLEQLGISHRTTIASAHRTPERVAREIAEAEAKGAEVIIAGAGMAAHLAGVVASKTVLPVIGVPLGGSSGLMGGLDALLSTVQMPPGIPVATVAVGKAGAKNAGWLAAQIMAVKDSALRDKIKQARHKMADEVAKKAEALDK